LFNGERVPRRTSPQWIVVFPAYLMIGAIVTYPFVRLADRAVSVPVGDPLLNTWILWWSTQHPPLGTAWWNASLFYPTPGVMGLSELLLGLLPITAPVQWISRNPLLAYNVAVLLSYPLCGWATYALAFELTGRHDAAWLAGAAFAFSPFRAAEFGHVQMLSYYWAPIALLALHRYIRRRHVVWLGAFAAAWLLQVLCNGYALFQLSVLIALWVLWFSPTAADVARIAGVWIAASLPLVPILLKYRQILGQLHLKRAITDIIALSADAGSFLSAPPELVIWGHRLIESTPPPPLFPGATILGIGLIATFEWTARRVRRPSAVSAVRLVLGAAAILCLMVASSMFVVGPWTLGPLRVSQSYKPFSLAVAAAALYFASGPVWRETWRSRSVPGFYSFATFSMLILSLGPAPHAWGRQVLYKAPYAWLMVLPGFDAIRVPARFSMLALLCVAMVTALVFTRWAPRLGRWRRPALVLITAGVIADGWCRLTFTVPATGPALTRDDLAAVIELLGEPDRDAVASYHSISNRRPIVNGHSGWAPPHYAPLAEALRDGDTTVLRELAPWGPIAVAVDRTAPEHTDLEDALIHRDGLTPVDSSARWAMFVQERTPQLPRLAGVSLPLQHVGANKHPEDVGRLMDGRIDTAWGSGAAQRGDEELWIELDRRQTVGAVELAMGSYSFGFPRQLAVETSIDGTRWTEVWHGPTARLTVRAGLQDPLHVRVLIDFRPTDARFAKLRQLGRDTRVPWWIAELSLTGPVPGHN
jgi:hypothetical protein